MRGFGIWVGEYHEGWAADKCGWSQQQLVGKCIWKQDSGICKLQAHSCCEYGTRNVPKCSTYLVPKTKKGLVSVCSRGTSAANVQGWAREDGRVFDHRKGLSVGSPNEKAACQGRDCKCEAWQNWCVMTVMPWDFHSMYQMLTSEMSKNSGNQIQHYQIP